jgi:hypothetical protein
VGMTLIIHFPNLIPQLITSSKLPFPVPRVAKHADMGRPLEITGRRKRWTLPENSRDNHTAWPPWISWNGALIYSKLVEMPVRCHGYSKFIFQCTYIIWNLVWKFKFKSNQEYYNVL